MACDDSSLDSSIPGSSASSKDLPFQRWAQWLGSISEHDAELLQLQPEYEDFITVMRRLEQAHITMLNTSNNNNNNNNNNTAATTTATTQLSSSLSSHPHHHSPLFTLLQHSLLLRIYDFLECRDLVASAVVCRRMYRLAHTTARLRTRSTHRPVSHLQAVRLDEQWHDRSFCTRAYTVVPRPFVLLERRIVVTECGDPELNGVYLCTAACGNGFEFTQPRVWQQNNCSRSQQHRRSVSSHKRCRIAKRFSGRLPLWYMSKDNIEDDDDDDTSNAGGAATYLYWAELMQEEQSGRAGEDLLSYPSLTSVLTVAENPGWQALPTAPLPPPVVELLE